MYVSSFHVQCCIFSVLSEDNTMLHGLLGKILGYYIICCFHKVVILHTNNDHVLYLVIFNTQLKS